MGFYAVLPHTALQSPTRFLPTFCPVFGWDRVNFLSGSWCNAVVWIWDENNVDNILMFSVVARRSRIFQLVTLAWPARSMGSWEGTQLGQLTQTGQTGILFRRTSCSVYKLRKVGWGAAITA